jgi:hypothetical protein
MNQRPFVCLVVGLLLFAGLTACGSPAPDVAPETRNLMPTATVTAAVAETLVAPDPTATAVPAAPTATPEPLTGEEPSPVVGTPEAIPGWVTFADDVYGYALQHPADWTYDEVDLHDPNVSPAGQMDRLLFFAPDGWSEPFIALELAVYDMDDETFAATFIPATREEQVIREDGLTYTKLIHDLGQVTMYQVLFRSESNPDVRVIFTDYVTGWPDRLAGNEAVAETFTAIFETFTFTD